jgi:ankyrin repeat protein
MPPTDPSDPSAPARRKRLPIRPSLEHLRKQAKRRAASRDAPLADEQFRLAREYGCRDWAELKRVVDSMQDRLDQPGTGAKMRPLPDAANRGDAAAVKRILETGQYTPHDLDLALARSVLRFDERGAIARTLLDHGADPDGQYGSGGYGPIVFVTGEGHDVAGLRFLIEAGADVTAPPIETKYGRQCVMSYWLGTYIRGRNDAKHRGIDLLLEHGAHVPAEVTPELLAVHRGDVAGLAKLIDADPELAHRRWPEMPYGNVALRGATLLHAAMDLIEPAVVDLLLERGALINAAADAWTDEDGRAMGGQSPLFHLVDSWKGHGQGLLRSLVQRLGNQINWSVRGTVSQFGERHGPLTLRQWLSRNAEAVRVVEEATGDAGGANAGLDAEVLDQFGKALVGDGGDPEQVRRMLDDQPGLVRSNPWAPGWVGTAIEAVAGMCVWHRPRAHEIAKLLVERGAAVSLQTAGRAGLLGEVDRQLAERPHACDDVDVQGRTAMYRAACVYGKFPQGEAVADRLIAAGARIDLHTACTLGMLDVVRDRLADDPQAATTPDPDGMTALHWAVRNRRRPDRAAAIVRLLLDAGADVEAANPTEDGMHPLHHVAEWPASPEVAQLLLDAGADVNALADGSRWTPLDYARDRGRDAMATWLTEQGAMASPASP